MRKDLPADQLVEYEIKLGVALASFAQDHEALTHLGVAVNFAREFGLGQRLFDAERKIAEIAAQQDEASIRRMPAPEPSLTPDIRETVESLFELSAAR